MKNGGLEGDATRVLDQSGNEINIINDIPKFIE